MVAESARLSRLATVAARSQTVEVVGNDPELIDLDHDSRRIGPGFGFLAVPGSRADGHEFAAFAAERGAAALIVERRLPVDIPQLVVEAVRPLMAPLAAEVHGHPSRELAVVGVTGTNGKTTVTHMIEAVAAAAGVAPGLIGTVGAHIAGEPVPLGHTTPEAPELQRLLRRMVERGVTLVAMEVSSHALALGRADAIDFDVVAFTNLSQDHLDFHVDMEQYFAAKRSLFTAARARLAAIYVDDDWGNRLAGEIDMPLWRVGFRPELDVWADEVAASTTGTTLTIHAGETRVDVTTRLAGRFNAANALLAAACALAVELPSDAIAAGLAAMDPVPGRFEPVDEGQPFVVIVDYAHTPDAMATVIAAMRPLAAGRVIAVGGAGGDRDRGKRPHMGRALAGADLAIITSDNPRSEDPGVIAAEVAATVADSAHVTIEIDRRMAITRALETAKSGDIVLILGKGHETGQQVGDEVLPFDDRRVAVDVLRQLAGRAS